MCRSECGSGQRVCSDGSRPLVLSRATCDDPSGLRPDQKRQDGADQHDAAGVSCNAQSVSPKGPGDGVLTICKFVCAIRTIVCTGRYRAASNVGAWKGDPYQTAAFGCIQAMYDGRWGRDVAEREVLPFCLLIALVDQT